MSEEEPKIFIDEGWKAQVQREKEEAARKAAEAAQAGDTSQAAIPVDGEEAAPELPEGLDEDNPTSFTALVGSLATQTMFALGLIADPASGRVMVNLEAARYTLDILAMLQEKTKGNLTAEESEALVQTCGELEQAFGVREQQVHEQTLRQSGIDPNNLKPE